MLIILGSVIAREDSFAEVLRLSQEHVSRSLQEPGCLRHEVLPDPDNARRLVFVEQWATADDLQRHFQVPASIAFARSVAALAADAPEMKIYEAREMAPPRPTAKPDGSS